MRHLCEHIGSFWLVEKAGGAGLTADDEELLVLFAAQAAVAIAAGGRHSRNTRIVAVSENIRMLAERPGFVWMPRRALRLKDVKKATRLSRSSIYALRKRGLFPPSVRIGRRAVGWFEDEVLDYLKSRPRVGADRATNRR